MTGRIVKIHPEAAGLLIVVSVSGGKDSTSLILALLEAVDRGEVPRHLLRFAFADTGWEAPETYAYLDYLRQKIGIEIVVVGVDGGMRARIRHRAGFPGRMQRWCTRELKIEPLREYHDQLITETGIETVSAMGIRAAESPDRAEMPEWADEPPGERSWGGYVWRPLLTWTVEDVLRIHNRHGVKVNPLYQRGHNRVGCYPCIFASKDEIRLIAEHAPERIDEIHQIEAEMSALRHQRNEERPGRYAHPDDAHFFQTRRQGFGGIRAVVAWARTDHGGRPRRAVGACAGGSATCQRKRRCLRLIRISRTGRTPRRDSRGHAPYADTSSWTTPRARRVVLFEWSP